MEGTYAQQISKTITISEKIEGTNTIYFIKRGEIL